ncbi:hypothetical protein BJ138DRAFT_1128861 [Hygrophoropsis aurantiaca]|uniref:Uncharacterized protein n=1 Tax=Hygrophoropsis aurantiaca TaxID=72124 RepID=A0ACB8A3D9_9AGAM|nr:hypothetical protein BJ138DRAFT_1128861 [Hygrophoropsis aurantiaca]
MADPALIQQLQMIQVLNYVDAAAGALVVYNQVLTFSQEASRSYMGNRQWSFTTALYLIARYSGSLYIIGNAALNMDINWTYSVNLNTMLAMTWSETIFVVTMQAILVIRVYALFNQSKKLLTFLTTLYALQTIAAFVLTALFYNYRALHEFVASVGPAIGSGTISISSGASAYFLLSKDVIFLPLGFDTIALLLALRAFVRHALETKTLGGGWSIHALVRTLVADHLAYFFCIQVWAALTIATNYATNDESTVLPASLGVFSALVVVFGPHMVISLRVIENKTRGEGGTLEGEVSTIRFGVREPPTQSESVVEEGGGLGAADENVRTD